jgi:hypothetical protein
MSLRIRFCYPTGQSLAYSVERLADGLTFDFANHGFDATPTTRSAPLVEGSAQASSLGLYSATLASPSTSFADGDYCVYVHDAAFAGQVVAALASTIYEGDDATLFPHIRR